MNGYTVYRIPIPEKTNNEDGEAGPGGWNSVGAFRLAAFRSRPHTLFDQDAPFGWRGAQLPHHRGARRRPLGGGRVNPRFQRRDPRD